MMKKIVPHSAIFNVILFLGIIIFCMLQPSEIAKANPTENNHYTIIADHLTIPWEIIFLSNNEMLVTERPGNLIILNLLNAKKTKIKLDQVAPIGEGGLLGMTLHPHFSKNHWIYFYLTTKKEGHYWNRVMRYQFTQHQLENPTLIIDDIPAAEYHNGGRIQFGPDEKLYITTGDATKSDQSQNINSLSGKILRLNGDGSIPADNPFHNAIYCYGLRNSQGLTWDNQDRLWATDHGRSFVLSGYDELNLIQRGKNYGWPIIQGPETKIGMVTPMVQSGPDTTWAPADDVYYRGSIFFTGLRGESIYQYLIEKKQLKQYFFKKWGRLRALVFHDGYFYISTSNRDGRGPAKSDDDKIIKIDPTSFSP